MLKNRLYDFCLNFVEQRIKVIQEAILEAQKAANEETKSSAGDKYETGRAMAQIDKDLNTRQLLEAQKLKAELLKIDLKPTLGIVQLGSLVYTSMGNYFLAISAGKIILENEVYFALSGASPLGTKLLHKKIGDNVDFNGKMLIINKIE
jgi:transcription elongation GreA/GreB family factor